MNKGKGNKKVKDSNTVLENFRTYWPDRDTSECLFGISILLDDQGWTGKGKLQFDLSEAPTIMLDGESWQVNSLKIHGSYELELNLSNKDIDKIVCISDDDIEKLEAYKLFQAVFDNTEHDDFDDIEDYYGWYLS